MCAFYWSPLTPGSLSVGYFSLLLVECWWQVVLDICGPRLLGEYLGHAADGYTQQQRIKVSFF